MENHFKFLLVGGIMIGASVGLFIFSFEFYTIPMLNTPSTVQVVSSDNPLTLEANLEKGHQTAILAKDVLSKGIVLNVEVKEPKTNVVFSQNFDGTLKTNFSPEFSGKYTLVVIPNANEMTTILAAIGDPSVVDRIEKSDTLGDFFSPIFDLYAYSGLGVFVGIILLIIGGIKALKYKIKSKRSFIKKEFS